MSRPPLSLPGASATLPPLPEGAPGLFLHNRHSAKRRAGREAAPVSMGWAWEGTHGEEKTEESL